MGLRREVAFGRAHLGVLLEAEGKQQGLGEITRAVEDLRALTEADPADVRVRHDLMATLVQLADVVRADQPHVAKRAYGEAREIALAFAAGAAQDSPSVGNSDSSNDVWWTSLPA